jgi:prevent-host-death family protein
VVHIKVSQARSRLAEVVENAQTEPIVIDRFGRPSAVLLGIDLYERLRVALEELEDIAAFDSALEEPGDNIPWDRVKSDLGWD